jgi:hypothetical protein
VRVLIVVVPHTFGAHLNFNCHLHILISAGELDEPEGRWVDSVEFDHAALMAGWRYAVITFLREALKANVLRYHLRAEKLNHVFTTQAALSAICCALRPPTTHRSASIREAYRCGSRVLDERQERATSGNDSVFT